MYMPTKIYLKQGLQIVINGENCDRKSQFSQILTEPLNPPAADVLIVKIKLQIVQINDLHQILNVTLLFRVW